MKCKTLISVVGMHSLLAFLWKTES
uniref:Uncharacterized protein n=1 Tax=Rhizophora mucronata TaxID=61149 RepID=A0A2P2IVE7_RHIMU